jgi:hypothetical protein
MLYEAKGKVGPSRKQEAGRDKSEQSSADWDGVQHGTVPVTVGDAEGCACAGHT